MKIHLQLIIMFFLPIAFFNVKHICLINFKELFLSGSTKLLMFHKIKQQLKQYLLIKIIATVKITNEK